MEKNSYVQELKEQLKFKDFELNSILEITRGITQDQSILELVEIYKFILKDQLRISKFILFLKEDEWEPKVKVGAPGRHKDLVDKTKLTRFKKVTYIDSSIHQKLAAFDVVIPFYHQEKPIAYLLLKENSKLTLTHVKQNFNAISFVQTLTNILVMAFENKRMEKKSLMQERLKKELEVASEMQQMLFPEVLPSDKRLDLAATYTAFHEVGGDYYDFIPITKDEFIICIGDVSGKGVGAAMLMANFQAILRTLLSFDNYNFQELIPELNKRVIDAARGEKFITFFIARYNLKTRELRYVNAGHNHPILTNGKRAVLLDKGTIGLGMMEEIPFLEEDKIQIEPNSTLVLYTDGVVELQNKAGDYFQTDRLIKLIHSFYPLKMEDLNNLIFSKLDEFREAEDLVDDTAIFSCRIF